MSSLSWMTGLKLKTLREANLRRLPHFKNSQGGLAHSRKDGSDWSPLEWSAAVGGEVGELQNLLKKVRRGDLSLDEARSRISDELADVLIYLDLTAQQCGIDLAAATISKFNAVSERVGSNVRIKSDGTDWEFALDSDHNSLRSPA